MKQRMVEPEVMDDAALDDARHRRALLGLARLNALSSHAASIHRAINDLLTRATPDRPLRLLDIATGGGDIPIALARRAARKRQHLRIHGCDISDTAIDHARRAADDAMTDITFFNLNALTDPIPGSFDVITCCQFLHHLREDQAELLLRKLAGAAQQRVVISDLSRNALTMAIVKCAAHLVTRSDVVHTDGPRSVRAAFTPAEALALAERAGLSHARVQTRFPCRFVLTWDRR